MSPSFSLASYLGVHIGTVFHLLCFSVFSSSYFMCVYERDCVPVLCYNVCMSMFVCVYVWVHLYECACFFTPVE